MIFLAKYTCWKKFLFRITLITIISSPKFNWVFAQDSTNIFSKISISSPNAASLGKYGDIPVNYHTGIPNISIPIYTVKSGNLSLPISLSYHASGLKVMEQASWVGAGWSLNAGGMITRTIRGAPDDRGYNNGYVFKGYYSDSGYHNYLFSSNGATLSTPQDDQFGIGRNDGEPDLFTFNFNGYSGKFYFNDDQSAVLVQEDDIKVQTDFAMGPGFQGFILTTSDGVKYYFGKTGNNGTVDPIEITYSITTQSSYGLYNRAASSWFLNKIVSADGMDSILLTYQTEKYSFYSLSMFPQLHHGTQIGQPNDYGTTWNGYYYEYDVAKEFVQGVHLSKITFPNGSINFTPQVSARSDLAGFDDQTMNDQADTSARALSTIQIQSSAGFCKSYNFYYNYFHDNSSLTGTLFVNTPSIQNIHSDSYRLRLDSIQEVSCDNSVKIPPYKFTYFSETVPRNLSFGIDHWGFYNGVTNNTTLLTSNTEFTDQTFVNVSGANRDAAWPAMRGGTLNTITYPTGGSTTFDFEANTTYTNFTNYVLNSRVSRSVGYDGGNLDKTDSFYYTFNSDYYKLDLSNTSQGGMSYIYIYPSGNPTSVNGTQANIGQTSTIIFKLTPGSYLIKLIKQSPVSGYGASYTLSEETPTTVSQNAIVGGLRIKTITNNDGVTSQPVITNYSYNMGNSPTGSSSGILYSRPTYIQILRNDVEKLVFGPAGFTNGCLNPDTNPPTLKDYFRSPSSVRPMQNTKGNHIGYNEVYVSQTGNGYRVYKYYGSNIWDNVTSDVCTRILFNSTICDVNIPNYPEAPPAFEPMRGELKYEGHYNQNGQLLKDVNYYPTFIQTKIPTPGHIDYSSQMFRSYTGYTLYTYRKVQYQTISTEYVPGVNSISSTKTIYYGSNFHHQPTRTVQTTSTGDSLATNLQYAFDFRIASCDNVPDSLTVYLNKVQADSSSYLQYINTCSPQNTLDINNCRYTQLTVLRQALCQDRVQYMNYLKRYFSNSNSVYNTCHSNAKSTAGSELKPVLELQDAYQNPVIEQSQWKDSNLLHADFTRYDYVTTPSGKIYPNKTQLINLSSPSTTFTNAVVSSNSIIKDSRYVDESNYTFNGGRLVEVTAKDGLTSAYIWGYNSSYPVAKVIGASYASSIATVNQTTLQNPSSDAVLRSALNNIRIQIPSALTSTYTYSPLIGMTSEVDPSGKTLLYNYDSLARLIAVRDTNNFILKKYCYSYQNQNSCTLFGNTLQSGTFTKNNCATGGTGSSVTYTVTANTYYATSQAAANTLAQNDVNANGQNYANTNGACTWLNAAKSGSFTRNNCGVDYTPSTVTYNVAAGTYSSTISQADADSKAQNDVNTNGQAYANSNGTCTVKQISVTSINRTLLAGFTVSYTNVSTSAVYTFSISYSTNTIQTLGTIPAGTYNVSISKGGNTSTFYSYYSWNGSCTNQLSMGGKSATFNNVSITSASTCNGVEVGPISELQ